MDAGSHLARDRLAVHAVEDFLDGSEVALQREAEHALKQADSMEIVLHFGHGGHGMAGKVQKTASELETVIREKLGISVDVAPDAQHGWSATPAIVATHDVAETQYELESVLSALRDKYDLKPG